MESTWIDWMKDALLLLCKVMEAGRSQSLNITFLEPCRGKKDQLRERFYLLLRLIELILVSSDGRELL